MKEYVCNDSCIEIITQAIDFMKAEMGDSFSVDRINLAELERRTGITRARLRRYIANGFQPLQHGRVGLKVEDTVLSGYTSVLDNLLRQGITNSSVCLDRLREVGYTGGQTVIKDYISKHRDLVPAKRQLTSPQGNRRVRFKTGPGEAYQMDWGFAHVVDPYGIESTVACFAMICHHCGKRYVEFFTNAKQENLFIGMIHAFAYMGVPEYVLTDNMKSVVIKRDFENHPIWQKDYESFMTTVGFKTKLCKPRHPFTKGKIERLIRFVKDNFLSGRCFWNLSDLNYQAIEWCEKQNNRYHKIIDDVPNLTHASEGLKPLGESPAIIYYLCPIRKISFDGFINYEGRRFGVPFKFKGATVRVCRNGDSLIIYTPDLKEVLVTHEVTWSKMDRYCRDQFAEISSKEVLEEHPTAPITTTIRQLGEPEQLRSGFDKFDFVKEAFDE